MATSQEYVEFVCEQARGEWVLRYRKMFGEYMVYVNDKPVLLVCDNTVYVKQLPCIENLMQNAEKGAPYKGAKEHYILDIEDREHALQIIEILEGAIAVPKPRKPKTKK